MNQHPLWGLHEPAVKPLNSTFGSSRIASSAYQNVTLDLFTVNLADRDADRYAQIQMAFELSDEKATEMVKSFMPVIRNSVLMTLSHKTSAELLEKDGKLKLSSELRREVAKALGMEPPPEEDQAAPTPKAKAGVSPEDISPVIGVHFSNFIIQ